MHPAPTLPRELPRHRLAVLALLLIAALLGLLLPGTAAHAADGEETSWSIRPGGEAERTNFSLTLEAGAAHSDTFVVTNTGGKALELGIYAADGITSSTGALDLLPASEVSSGVGAWVVVDTPAISVAPGQATTVAFTVTVPAGTEPGDYVGGLISSSIDGGNGATVQVDRRLATRFNLRVAGEGRLGMTASAPTTTTATALNPFAPVAATTAVTLTNTGTVRARGPVTVTLAGPFGLGSTSTTLASPELIPGGTATLEVPVGSVWPLGWLTTTVELTPEGVDGAPGTVSVADAGQWALPWGQLGALLLLILLAVVLGVRRGRGADDAPVADAVEPGQA